MSAAKAPEPKAAAGIIVARAAAPRGFEVLLTLALPDEPRGAGDAEYGFPAGPCRDEDGADAMLARCRGLAPERARAIAGGHFSPRKASALWATAIRDLFEQTGILLASVPGARPAPLSPGVREKMHAALAARRASFSELLGQEDLFCDAGALVYFSRWQIPIGAAGLCDIRFFLAELPEGQAPFLPDRGAAQAQWMIPDQALCRFDQSQLPMGFAIFASLRTLADFDSLDAVMKEFRGNKS